MKLILCVMLVLIPPIILAQRYGQKYAAQHGPDLTPKETLHEEVTYKPKVYEVYSQIAPSIGDGKFEYYVETSDGLRAEQVGYLHKKPEASQVHEGTYTTFDDAGKVVMVNYIADKQGFRASGQGLPTSPPEPIEHVLARENILKQQEDIRQQHLASFRAAHAAYGRKY